MGLEAQRRIVEATAKNGRVVAAYTDIESGRKNDRPELLKALAHCRQVDATLLIAKLDRLPRNVAFIVNLMESGVEFSPATGQQQINSRGASSRRWRNRKGK